MEGCVDPDEGCGRQEVEKGNERRGPGLSPECFVKSNELFGRAPALPKIAPTLAPQMERLLWWSWSRFRKYLAKQLHLLD